MWFAEGCAREPCGQSRGDSLVPGREPSGRPCSCFTPAGSQGDRLAWSECCPLCRVAPTDGCSLPQPLLLRFTPHVPGAQESRGLHGHLTLWVRLPLVPSLALPTDGQTGRWAQWFSGRGKPALLSCTLPVLCQPAAFPSAGGAFGRRLALRPGSSASRVSWHVCAPGRAAWAGAVLAFAGSANTASLVFLVHSRLQMPGGVLLRGWVGGGHAHTETRLSSGEDYNFLLVYTRNTHLQCLFWGIGGIMHIMCIMCPDHFWSPSLSLTSPHSHPISKKSTFSFFTISILLIYLYLIGFSDKSCAI